MNVLFTGYYFDGYHGSMLHICELAEFFHKKGYRCYCASVVVEPFIVEYCQTRNLTVLQAHELPLDLDYEYVFAYHFPILPYLLGRGLKYSKIVIGCLSSTHPLELPMDFYADCTLLTAVSGEARQNLEQKFAIPSDGIFLFKNLLPENFIQFDFTPSPQLRKIAVVSNHPPREINGLPQHLPDIEVDFWGVGQANYGALTPQILSQYDAVITIGKTVQYCLGMGLPVFVYDQFGGNGYVRLDTLEAEEFYSFSGRSTRRKLESTVIATELISGYPQACGEAPLLKKIAAERYGAERAISRLLEKADENAPCQIDTRKHCLEIAHYGWLTGELIGRYNGLKYMKNELYKVQARLEDAHKQSEEYRTQLSERDKALDYIMYSKSWRLTTPLRKIMQATKRTKNLINTGGGMTLYTVIAVRNEALHMQGFFDHLREYVDGFVVLDDGSTDATPAVIKRERKVISCLRNLPHDEFHWDERGNRIALLNEARKRGADIVLCCDADERYEIRFLKNLRRLAKECREKKTCMGLKICELWDSVCHYRVDGVWDTKKKFVLFPLSEHMTFDTTMFQEHHIHWHYDQIKNLELLPYNLYHLKMIRRRDRAERAELYERLDPEHKLQKIGYRYLTDEDSIQLQAIPESAAYDYATVPNELTAASSTESSEAAAASTADTP